MKNTHEDFIDKPGGPLVLHDGFPFVTKERPF